MTSLVKTSSNHIHDLEQIVLGTLLIDINAIHLVSSLLQPNMFGYSHHSAIYTVMIDCYEKNIPLDLISITDACAKANVLEKIGDTIYLVELTDRVVSSANLEYHCRILMQYWGKRTLTNLCIQLKEKAKDNTTEFFEILDDLELKLNSFKDKIMKGHSKSIQNIASEVLMNIEKTTPDSLMKGFPIFGVIALDIKIGGAEGGDLIIIAGRPSMGKSSLANCILRNAVLNIIPTLFWSLEMSNEATMHRLMSALSGIPLKDIRSNNLSKENWSQLTEVTEHISSSSLVLEDTAGISVLDFRSKIISLKRTMGLKVAILDRIGLLKFLDEKGHQVQEITKITKLLRRTAKELDITIIALNQLNRSVETRGGHKIPQLSDLRGSGTIEQDATKTLLLYRPEYYDILEDEHGNSLKGAALIFIAKNTFGETGAIKCSFDAERTQFLDFDEF